MQLLIYGPGRLGGAIAAAAAATGWPAPVVVGRPDRRRARPARPAPTSSSTPRSRARSPPTSRDALAGGQPRVRPRDDGLGRATWPGSAALLLDAGAAAVVAPNLSLGAALFLRLAETAAGWYARAGAFEPSIVEWHRRGKADRPSGTARALARRIAAADPRWAVPEPGTNGRRAAVTADGRARPRGRRHPRRRRARHPPRDLRRHRRVDRAPPRRPRPLRLRRGRPRRRPLARPRAARARHPPVRRGRRRPARRVAPRACRRDHHRSPSWRNPPCPRPSRSAARSPR